MSRQRGSAAFVSGGSYKVTEIFQLHSLASTKGRTKTRESSKRDYSRKMCYLMFKGLVKRKAERQTLQKQPKGVHTNPHDYTSTVTP